MKLPRARLFRLFFLVAPLMLGACATSPPNAASGAATSLAANPDDPWEGFNRKTHAFNEGLDRYLLKPAAQGYDAVTPTPVRAGISNFFSNLGDLWVGANSLLQGKVKDAVSDVGRFLVNSTIGVFGLIDVASPMGLPKHNEDFGQTLAVWGVDSGPYLVLPLLGPRTLRDSGGVVVDLYADRLEEIEPVRLRNSAIFLRQVEWRAGFLPAEKILDQAAIDKYSYLRSAYLQRRRSLIYDGKPPREERFDDE